MLLSVAPYSFIVLLKEGIQISIEFKIVTMQMKAVEKLVSGTEIDLSELETRANQPKILKVAELGTCYMIIWAS